MNLPDDGKSGLRRAALALHAVHETDRDWLMQQLPAADQAALNVLLQELQALRIPPDPVLVRHALGPARVEMLPAAIAADEAVRLCRALEMEAPELQPMLLATLAENDRAAVLMHWRQTLTSPPVPSPSQDWPVAVREAARQSWFDAARAWGGDA